MDIANIQPTATVTFEIDRGEKEPLPITFTVALIPLDMIGDYFPRPQLDAEGKPKPARPLKLSGVIRSMLIEAVQGWDLTEKGEPLECNEANKEKHLPFILGLRVKGKANPENPFANVLGRALLEFAADSENFLKN